MAGDEAAQMYGALDAMSVPGVAADTSFTVRSRRSGWFDAA